jgi:hypothetical protein
MRTLLKLIAFIVIVVIAGLIALPFIVVLQDPALEKTSTNCH